MKFQIAFATLLSFVAAATAAAAVDEVPYVIETHDLGADGTLTVYGINAVNGGEKPTLQARQCGNSAVSCSSSNTATRAVCATLINLVCNGNDSLSHDPRSICLTQSGAQCCISWSTDVGAFTESALCPSAQATFNSCTGGTVSGFQPNTPLNGGCVTQCLSNRPNGCG